MITHIKARKVVLMISMYTADCVLLLVTLTRYDDKENIQYKSLRGHLA